MSDKTVYLRQQYWVRKKKPNDPLEKFVDPKDKDDNLIIYDLGKNFSHYGFVISHREWFGDALERKNSQNIRKQGGITDYLIKQENWLRIRQCTKWFIDCNNIEKDKTVILDFIFWALNNNKMRLNDLIEIVSWTTQGKSRQGWFVGDQEYGARWGEERGSVSVIMKILETKSQNIEKIMKIGVK